MCCKSFEWTFFQLISDSCSMFAFLKKKNCFESNSAENILSARCYCAIMPRARLQNVFNSFFPLNKNSLSCRKKEDIVTCCYLLFSPPDVNSLFEPDILESKSKFTMVCITSKLSKCFKHNFEVQVFLRLVAFAFHFKQ